MEDALAANADVVLRIDVQGAATVRRMMPNAVSIFLVGVFPVKCRARAALRARNSEHYGSRCALQTAECEAEMVQRLVSRKTETMVSHMPAMHACADAQSEHTTDPAVPWHQQDVVVRAGEHGSQDQDSPQ